MSRSYLIRLPIEVLLSASSREKLGKYSISFTLLGILGDERMKELLRQKLLEKGCTETDEGLKLPCDKEGDAVFDLENLRLNLQVKAPEGISIRIEEESLGHMQSQIDRALADGETINDGLTRMAQNEFGHKTAAELKELAMETRQMINDALKETYRDAIKEKASQFGNISNISENCEGSTYRIRIEVDS